MCWRSMLTVANIKIGHFLHFTNRQAGQTRKGFRICACLLGIPKPFFTLRVATRFCETLKCLRGILQKSKKSRSQTPIKSVSDSGCAFVVFLIPWDVLFRKRHVQQIRKNIFLVFHSSLSHVLSGSQVLSVQISIQKLMQSVSSASFPFLL